MTPKTHAHSTSSGAQLIQPQTYPQLHFYPGPQEGTLESFFPRRSWM